MKQNSPYSNKNIDPELQWAIDNQYRTNPEIRDEILGSLDSDDLDSYIVNVEHGDVKLKYPPEQILEKLTGLSDLGNVITTMRGGNGVAIITDKDLVVKITGDKAEYITAKELQGIDSNYIVKVHESKVIDPDDQSIYTEDSKPAYLIIMDKVDSPTPEEEMDWFDCCCSEDKPIYVDFTDPNGDAMVHPPVDDYDKCDKIYNDIMNIRKEVEKTGRRWVDIGIDNVGMKDGNYTLIDLGTNDPLPLNENKKIINEGFFDIMSSLFKRPEQKSDTPDELNQYLQQLQDTLDENEIYDEEVSRLVDELKDSDYIDLVDFPTMLRGLENKLLKSGNNNEIVIDYLSRLNKSLPKRAKYEKKLLQGQVPEDSEYYDEVEQEKSRIPKKVFKTEKELLQIELLKLQEWVKKNNVPVVLVFEGRDTAGKGSTIKKLTEYLDPRYYNVVALGIPTEDEKKNWFQRYEKYIEPGKITFFDRSWYNRGIVEPVMGYSSKEEYEQFMKEVVPFEKSLLSRGVILIKFWLSITQGKQEQRFTIRQQSPLKYWKYSPNDEASREKWDEYTDYKERVLKDTSHGNAPWVVLDSNDKRVSALNAMRHVLDQVEYDGKDTETVRPKYPEAISTIRRRLDEQSEEEPNFTKSAQRVLNTAWSMSKDSPHKFVVFRSTLNRFFNVPPTTAEDLTFLCKYNIQRGNEEVEEWVIPYIYESTVYVYGDYDTESYYDDCDEEGMSEDYGQECECQEGEIMDEEEAEYRPCDEQELEDVHYDDECECNSWEDPTIELYYYPIYRKTVYSTSDPNELGCVYDSHHDLDDYMGCLSTDDEVVEVMSEEHEDDTDRVLEEEFDYDKEHTIADTWEYDIDIDDWSGSYMINKINELYPDKPTPEQLNENRLGSRGSDVKDIQQKLLDLGYDLPKFGADGQFGPETRNAVTQYQIDNNLAVDGIVGPETSSSLFGNSNKKYQDTSDDEIIGAVESNVEINTNTPTVIFVGGLDTRSGDKSLSQQEADLRKGLGGNFKIISHRYTDGSGAVKSLQQNPNAFVVLFSAGAKHAEDLVSDMSNPSKMYIVEPYTCSSTRKKGVENAITKGVPRTNVLGGPSDCTGKNVAGTFRSSYNGKSHWDAVRGVGQIIKNSTRLNEQQMSLFPTGEWRLPVGEEDELEKLERMLPESIVKIIFERWDKEEPLRMDNRDFKLFGLPNDERLLLFLIVRYLQNTTRPIPVGRVWDCDDLVSLFKDEDRSTAHKYLCEEDFDYESMYGYDEWYDGMLDNLDDMSWKYITTLLGVDKSTAEKLLDDSYTTAEEGEIWREKEDDIEKIKSLMGWANERAAADTTFSAIRQDIKDEIEEHFENEGKFEYDHNGNIVYEIKGDLKDYVQDPDTWDNIERFNNHEEFRDRHLQDILYDFDLRYKGRDGFQQSLSDVIFNLFMENDFAIWWDSEKDYLEIDGKFFDNYWYPDYDFNQDFREYMMEEYYDELRGNINEQKNYDAEIELTNSDAYIEETPTTKKEATILNLILDRFSIEELNELVSNDVNEIGSDLENKWINFVKLIGEKVNTPETFTKSTRWAKWMLDNLDKAEYENEEGEIDIDFNNVDILTKNYPSVYEVEGDEALWQKEYRRAIVNIPAFDRDDARDRADTSFWEYDPDFETYDYGDADSDYFNIEDIEHYTVLKEQIIDTENLPEEEISPDLVEGDKVFAWDIEPDPAPPGGPSNIIPSTVIGVVTEVMPDDIQQRRGEYRGGIKYIIDTSSGLIGLYQGVEDYNHYADDGGGRDKWVKLNKQNLQEIKKITDLKNIERQKDFTLKKSFMESINNLTEKDITPIKESVVESRVTLFNYLDGITKTNLVKEEEIPNLLIGGRTWADRFTVSSSIDLDDIKENSNKVRDIIFNNTKLKLNNPSFIETKRDLLETAKQTVTLWKESSNIISK